MQSDVDQVLKEILGNHSVGRIGGYEVKWPMRHYRAKPEVVTPAKDAYSKRQSNITVRKVAS